MDYKKIYIRKSLIFRKVRAMAVSVVKEEKKYIENDVRKMSLFKLGWPVFIQCLLSLCLGYVDTLMISRYSSTAVGGLGNANQILGFLTLAFTVISSAAGVIIAQYIGDRKSVV